MLKSESLSEVQRQLLEKGRIDLVGDVDESMAWYVREALMRLSARGSWDVIIQVTSNGGNVTIGLDIFDFFLMYPGRKIGLVNGFAHSMAALILQACDVRLCTTHSRILIHHIANSKVKLDILRDKRRRARFIHDMETDQQRLYAVLSRKTGHSVGEIKRVCAKDEQMSVTEAKAFGLVDHIVASADDLARFMKCK